MMSEHYGNTDDPIGAYAAEQPPVFLQVHVPPRSGPNFEYLKSISGVLKGVALVSKHGI